MLPSDQSYCMNIACESHMKMGVGKGNGHGKHSACWIVNSPAHNYATRLKSCALLNNVISCWKFLFVSPTLYMAGLPLKIASIWYNMSSNRNISRSTDLNKGILVYVSRATKLEGKCIFSIYRCKCFFFPMRIQVHFIQMYRINHFYHCSALNRE